MGMIVLAIASGVAEVVAIPFPSRSLRDGKEIAEQEQRIMYFRKLRTMYFRDSEPWTACTWS